MFLFYYVFLVATQFGKQSFFEFLLQLSVRNVRVVYSVSNLFRSEFFLLRDILFLLFKQPNLFPFSERDLVLFLFQFLQKVVFVSASCLKLRSVDRTSPVELFHELTKTKLADMAVLEIKTVSFRVSYSLGNHSFLHERIQLFA